ncbi:hypothetical protein BS639_17210 [Rouxiella silvae]|uniref:Cyanophage baseplate Pam3 plug gp18 domain-containing protein n=1 Tax=Rouxiella silvae TaxID=1646373 RepID=A0ABX3TXV8_9GAMM|nr:hypothetical protein [Rouxiella silvae]ORJ20051.1 hypothetical protein BS639_17210 [Rouxiella silvae]
MTANEIPLSPDNQKFSITLNSVSYRMNIIWRDTPGWVMDLQDSSGVNLIAGIPLVTGADLLGQYGYLGLGFSLLVMCDDDTQEYPTKTDLGTGSHLYYVLQS